MGIFFNMMIKRDIKEHLIYLSKKYPVITITGPRQSGKTTIAKEVFKSHEYVNLENIREREFAKNDPEKFLAQFAEGAIIDEIQHVPELTSYIQVMVDERKKDGMFILTGSRNFSLIKSVSQSLAGRTSITELLPLSYSEISKSKYEKMITKKKSKSQIKLKEEKLQLDKLLYSGLYPKIYQKNINPSIYYGDYIKTYIERDLRDLENIKDLSKFRSFIILCASRVGQLLNLSNISNDLGVSSTTLKGWLSILEASYIVFLLRPYNSNINKQLIKSPKLYFTDTGLICYLLGIDNEKHLSKHPLRGSIFENLIILEVLKSRLNAGKSNNLNFYGDKRYEIDLLYNVSSKFSAFEIKSAETVSSDFYKNLDYLSDLLPEKIIDRGIIYAGSESYEIKKNKILNLENLNGYLKKLT